MTEGPVNDALEQVRQMQAVVGDRMRFQGFSARARMAGGFVAVAGAIILQRLGLPDAPRLHLLGWAVVLLVAGGINYGALLLWLLAGWRVRRAGDWIPALESMPPLAVGGALSLVFFRAGMYDLLPGMWMLCYGLVHMAYRRNLPLGVYLVGFFYLAAGLACLLISGLSFTDPRPMGVVFGVGEVAGGLALRRREGSNG